MLARRAQHEPSFPPFRLVRRDQVSIRKVHGWGKEINEPACRWKPKLGMPQKGNF